MKSLGFFVEMDAFWLKMHFFRIMAAIFEGELFKEFQHLHQVIFPSLNECDFCNKKYYFRRTTSNCRTIECEACKTFKPAKSSFIKKCTKEQVKYLEHFFRDFFSVSEFSSNFFDDLVPLSDRIRNRNRYYMFYF